MERIGPQSLHLSGNPCAGLSGAVPVGACRPGLIINGTFFHSLTCPC